MSDRRHSEPVAHEGELQSNSTSPHLALATESGNSGANESGLGATMSGVVDGRERDAPVPRRKPSRRAQKDGGTRRRSGLDDRGVFGSILLEFAHGNLYPTGFSGRHTGAEGPDPRVVPGSFPGRSPVARSARPCWTRSEMPVAGRPVSRAGWWMVAPVPPSRQPRANRASSEGRGGTTPVDVSPEFFGQR